MQAGEALRKQQSAYYQVRAERAHKASSRVAPQDISCPSNYLLRDSFFILSRKMKGVIFMSENKIPYKIYLEESEMPKYWYNLRADMNLNCFICWVDTFGVITSESWIKDVGSIVVLEICISISIFSPLLEMLVDSATSTFTVFFDTIINITEKINARQRRMIMKSPPIPLT